MRDLERKIIGGMLQLECEPMPQVVAALEPEYFSSGKLGTVYSAVKELVDEGKPADLVTVDILLKSWDVEMTAELAELAWDMPTMATIGYYASILLAAGRKQELDRRVAEVMRGTEGLSFEATAAKVQDAMVSIDAASDIGGFVPIRKILTKVMDDLEAEMNHPDGGRFTRTGIESVDSILSLGSSELLIVGARPSMGKTAFAGNIAQHIAREENGGGVAIFSMEMKAEALVKRMLSSLAPSSSHGNVLDAVKRGHGNRMFAEVDGLDIMIDDRPHLSTADMRRSLLRLDGVRVVIVDYLQLAKTNAKLERQDLRVGAVSKGLKGIAKDLDCLVIGLSQLNRDVESSASKRPEMRHLRNSGEIEEDADAIALLYRPSHYGMDGDDEVIIAKQRNGPTDTAYVHFKKETQVFSSVYRDREPGDHRHTDFRP